MSQLSARMNRAGSSSVGAGGGGGGGGGDGSDGSAAGSGGAGREGGDGGGGGGGGRKARGVEVTEAEIASLRRQMKAATQVSLLVPLLLSFVYFEDLNIGACLS